MNTSLKRHFFTTNNAFWFWHDCRILKMMIQAAKRWLKSQKKKTGRKKSKAMREWKSENNVLTSAENSVYFKVNETQLTKAAHQNECTHVISYLSSWNRSPYNRQLYKSCVWVCDYFFSLCLPFNFRFMYENFLKACGCINVTSVTAISGNRPQYLYFV